MISFDANASAPVLQEALDAYIAALDCADPARALREAQDIVGSVFGVPADHVAFTSGGTESDAIVVAFALSQNASPSAVTSIFEHPAVMENIQRLASTTHIWNDDLCRGGSRTALISICMASSETGMVLPIADIARMAKEQCHDVIVHTDAVQAVGRMPVNIQDLGVDVLSLTGHKLGAVPGIGALVGPLVPRLRDAGVLPDPMENIPGAVSLGVAMTHLPSHTQWDRWRMQQARLESLVRELGGTVIGENYSRLPQTTCAHFPGRAGEVLLQLMDLEGVAVSAGTACSSGSIEASSTLLALGMSSEAALQTIRMSLPRDLSDDDLNRGLDVLQRAVGRFTIRT